MPSSVSIANTMPPLAEPSSLVSTTPVTCGRVAELTGLGEAVLPGRGIDHEQRLGDPPDTLLGDPAHLAQLLHQVRLGVQATGGVGEDEIDVLGRGPLDPVVDDGRRIAACLAPDELDTGPFGPRPELLGRRGAERVAGRHQHRPADGRLLARDLADGGGLADAVDADEQPHVRTPGRTGLEVQLPVGAGEALGHVGLERVEQRSPAR